MSQRLNSYFASSPELRQLSSRAGQLIALQKVYEQIAPASLIRFSGVLQLERQILTLGAHNGAVAAKLRQLVPELTQSFQNRGCEVTGILVRVQVTSPLPAVTGTPHVLSLAGRNRLIELAVELPDSPLKIALQRLAQKSGQRFK